MTTNVPGPKKAVPLQQGLFHIPASPGDTGYLIGSKCSNCGYVAFPRRVVCASCVKDDTMKELRLSGKARLDRFTVAHQAPAGMTAPYIQAYVQLEEGPMLYTLVTGVEQKAEALQLDQPMEAVIEKIREDEQGNDLIAWKFRPVKR
ncbi:MAG: OB-fold domain-containing protein [Dehalococcoidia bacterium]|nr:OB-fold domain-containing protein [Dehalococcoidia bacterium]